MRNWIMVEDGATVVVLARTDITVGDPTDEFPYVAQAYRIVADRTAPTLKLVPLSETPTKLRVGETPHELLQLQRFVAELTGWKFGQPLLKGDNES